MDMSNDEPSVYVPMQEQLDAIKYADIQPSPYESTYQQDLYQEQGLAFEPHGDILVLFRVDLGASMFQFKSNKHKESGDIKQKIGDWK